MITNVVGRADKVNSFEGLAVSLAEMTDTRGSLGLVQATALYVGAVLGTGVLVLPAIAAETAGPASLIAWTALVALSIPMALTYAAMSRQRPDAGGFSDAIERAFGPRWGAVSGWIFLAQVPTGYAVASLIAGTSAASALGQGRDAGFLLAALLLVAVFIVNALGLRVSATAQSIAVGVIGAAILVVIVRALPRVDAAAFTPFFPSGPLVVGLAAVQLFWAFVGWEAITPLAADIRHPADLWRATLIAVRSWAPSTWRCHSSRSVPTHTAPRRAATCRSSASRATRSARWPAPPWASAPSRSRSRS
jgi:amino acid efflux transporter